MARQPDPSLLAGPAFPAEMEFASLGWGTKGEGAWDPHSALNQASGCPRNPCSGKGRTRGGKLEKSSSAGRAAGLGWCVGGPQPPLSANNTSVQQHVMCQAPEWVQQALRGQGPRKPLGGGSGDWDSGPASSPGSPALSEQ